MPEYTPTQGTFTYRLAALVNERGIDRVAQDYDRSPRTVRGWIRGQTRPSGRTQRSVVRRGLRLTGPTTRRRNPQTGQFEVIARDRRTSRAVSTIIDSRLSRRRAIEETATSDRQREAAFMEPIQPTDEEVQDLDRQLQQITKDEALGRDTSAQWRRFDRDYKAMMGNA